ncbi:O-succinylbenzoate synthase [Arcanobacterium haemolyticum]|nr:O-succinylbenzoate synthase [Arcanobacterium haemolyticum]
MDVYIYSSPLHTRFRGLTVRDGLLLRGPAGWGKPAHFGIMARSILPPGYVRG